MKNKFWQISTLLIMASYVSTYPTCLAQRSKMEFASAAPADGSENTAAASEAPAAPPVKTEVASAPAVPGADVRPAMVKELEAMKQRIAELEAELAASGATTADAATALESAKEKLEPHAVPAAIVQTVTPEAAAAPTPAGKIVPFSDWDWTWLNGNPRNKDTAFDSKFFTPEIRADITYTYDFNKPIDDSMGGSSELFRSNEIQLEQLGIGGDFHLDNVRARFMTQFKLLLNGHHTQ
jgi:hypothetical protein